MDITGYFNKVFKDTPLLDEVSKLATLEAGLYGSHSSPVHHQARLAWCWQAMTLAQCAPAHVPVEVRQIIEKRLDEAADFWSAGPDFFCDLARNKLREITKLGVFGGTGQSMQVLLWKDPEDPSRWLANILVDGQLVPISAGVSLEFTEAKQTMDGDKPGTAYVVTPVLRHNDIGPEIFSFAKAVPPSMRAISLDKSYTTLDAARAKAGSKILDKHAGPQLTPDLIAKIKKEARESIELEDAENAKKAMAKRLAIDAGVQRHDGAAMTKGDFEHLLRTIHEIRRVQDSQTLKDPFVTWPGNMGQVSDRTFLDPTMHTYTVTSSLQKSEDSLMQERAHLYGVMGDVGKIKV